MKVTKFGGSSVANAAQIRKVAEIVRTDPARRIVVVSAPGRRTRRDIKVTDLLIDLARARLVQESVATEFDAVITRFSTIVRGLKLQGDLIERLADDLRERLEGDRSDERAFMDTIKAFGEDHCARIVAAFLRAQGVDADYVSPAEAGLLLSDEPGNAQVLQHAYGNLRALRDRREVVVFPGFYGYAESGRLVTFPRGGSDITGAILAAAVDAELYENFTDTDGIYSADPGIVKGPKPVSEITFREMRELAYAGFSVFHDEALEPVFHAGIPVNVRNTNRPEQPGTVIRGTRDTSIAPIVGVTGMTGICSVYISRYLMNREVGFGRKVLSILEDEEVPFEHLPTGIDNLSLVLREDNFSAGTEERVLRRIRTELGVDEVRVERHLALVMVVGEGMKHQIGTAARACTAFSRASINLEMINQGSSEVSMMFAIHQRHLKPAIQALHTALIRRRR